MFIFLIIWKASCIYIVVREQFRTIVFLTKHTKSNLEKKCHFRGAEAYNLIKFWYSVDVAFRAASMYKAKHLFFFANDKYFVRSARAHVLQPKGHHQVDQEKAKGCNKENNNEGKGQDLSVLEWKGLSLRN